MKERSSISTIGRLHKWAITVPWETKVVDSKMMATKSDLHSVSTIPYSKRLRLLSYFTQLRAALTRAMFWLVMYASRSHDGLISAGVISSVRVAPGIARPSTARIAAAL